MGPEVGDNDQNCYQWFIKTPDPAAVDTVHSAHTPLFSTAYHGNEGRETEGEQVGRQRVGARSPSAEERRRLREIPTGKLRGFDLYLVCTHIMPFSGY